MAKEIQKNTQTIFAQIRHVDENSNDAARQIAKVPDYAEFRNFIPVLSGQRKPV